MQDSYFKYFKCLTKNDIRYLKYVKNKTVVQSVLSNQSKLPGMDSDMMKLIEQLIKNAQKTLPVALHDSLGLAPD